jgi:hypothetical protein
MYTGYLAPTSNRSDWSEAVQLVDTDSGEIIDISGCRITMTVRSDAGQAVLTASTDDASITLPDVGTFLFNFTAQQMSGLCPGAYAVGVRVAQDDRTMQLLIGNINVMEGIDVQ